MIKLTDIHFRYKRKKPLIEGLDLRLEAGKIYGLFGLNGAGKTTLLKIIAGLRYPIGGKADVMGFNPIDRKPELLNEIFFLAEDTYVPPMTPGEMEKKYAPFYPGFDIAYYNQLLSDFNIDLAANTKHMSFGQMKKTMISFALATRCKLIIMDEPTNSLDIPSKSTFRKTMASAQTEEQCIIISTHQVRDLESLIENILILEKGQIIFNQSVDDITSKLQFRHIPSTENVDVLFSEPSFGGYNVIMRNKNGDDSRIEMEALFKLVIESPTLQETFKNIEL
jgi:ABC-2 type transport system ATP-binding protein